MDNNSLKKLLDNYDMLNSSEHYLSICDKISASLILEGEKVAIWGTGIHTEELLQLLEKYYLDVNIVCYFDNDNRKWGCDYRGKTIYSPGELKSIKIDKIIVSSYEFRKEIKKQVFSINKGMQCLDLYDELALQMPFYQYDPKNKMNIRLRNILGYYSALCRFDLENTGIKDDIQLNKRLDACLTNENLVYDEIVNINDLIDCRYFYDYLKEKLINPCPSNINRNKVVYFTQNPTAWTSFQSVYEEYMLDNNAEVIVVQVPFIHNSYQEKGQMRDFLLSKQIPFIPWYFYDFNISPSDLVYFQNPYDNTRPKEFTVGEVSDYGPRIVYIPYAFELIKKWPGSEKDYIDVLSQTPLFKKSWRIFLRSERSKKMYSAYSSRGDEHLIVTGHPKIDSIVNYSVTKEEIISTNKRYRELVQKKVILWTPNIGEFGGEEKWGFLFSILDIITEFQNIVIVLRPHPMKLARLKDNTISDDKNFEKFKVRIKEIKNIILDDEPDYLKSFTLSDALMTCYSSLIFEYLATKKPILCTPQDYQAELNADGEIVEYLYVANEIEDIKRFFSDVAKGIDGVKEKRMAAIPEFLCSIDGNNGKRIKNYIENHLCE